MNLRANAPPSDTTRRELLKVTTAAGGGLLIALTLGHTSQAAETFEPNVYIRIPKTGKIVIVAKSPELGQGIRTAFPMIIAEELDAAWARDIKSRVRSSMGFRRC